MTTTTFKAPRLSVYRGTQGADVVLHAAIERGDLGELPEPLMLALGARRRLDQLARDVGALPTAHADALVAATVEMAMTGQPLDAAVFEGELLRAALTRTAHEHDVLLFSRMQDRARMAWLALVSENAGALLDGLRDQLVGIITDARQAAEDLGGLDLIDPVAVMSATEMQRAAIMALPLLADRYARLRVAQQAVLATAHGGSPATRQLDYREAGETSWAEVFDTGVHETADFDDSPVPPADGDPVARLLAILPRRVWVPTVAELAALGTRIATAINANLAADRVARDAEFGSRAAIGGRVNTGVATRSL